MGIADWVSKKLLSDNARAGGASAAALKKQEVEDARLKAQASKDAEAEKAKKDVEAIRFKRGGIVKSNKSSNFKW